MILEHCQLLCSVHWMTNSEAPYKLTHKNHPCAIWVRESLDNYDYLCQLTQELCREYTYRYKKHHKCETVLNYLISNKPNIPSIGFTYPALAMPNEYKQDCYIESYRMYYIKDKQHLANWNQRNIPSIFYTLRSGTELYTIT